MIPRWLYSDLRRWAHYQHRGVPLCDYIKNQPYREFSEFNAIGAYAYLFHKERFEWVNTEDGPMPEPCARQFRSYDGLGIYKDEIGKILPAVPVPAEPKEDHASELSADVRDTKSEARERAPSSSGGGRTPKRDFQPVDAEDRIVQTPKPKRRKRRRRWTKEQIAAARKRGLEQWEKRKAPAQ